MAKTKLLRFRVKLTPAGVKQLVTGQPNSKMHKDIRGTAHKHSTDPDMLIVAVDGYYHTDKMFHRDFWEAV